MPFVRRVVWLPMLFDSRSDIDAVYINLEHFRGHSSLWPKYTNEFEWAIHSITMCTYFNRTLCSANGFRISVHSRTYMYVCGPWNISSIYIYLLFYEFGRPICPFSGFITRTDNHFSGSYLYKWMLCIWDRYTQRR